MANGLDLSGLHPGLKPYAEYALRIAQYNGFSPYVTSVARTWAEQASLYANYLQCKARTAQGLSTAGLACKYPANPPGASAHQPHTVGGLLGALAFDSTVDPQYQEQWNAIRRYVGFRVPENDLIHAELPNWTSYA